MAAHDEHNAYVALHAFLSCALKNGHQAEQKAQIILTELAAMSSEQLGKFIDLCKDWYAMRK